MLRNRQSILSGKIQIRVDLIRVDLTHLNESVIRERHILPAVDETLAKLEGARVFTKLEQIKTAQTSDNVCKRLSRYIAKGWPDHRRDVHKQLLPYWPERSVLHEGDCL